MPRAALLLITFSVGVSAGLLLAFGLAKRRKKTK
jgi:hypothetical protein